MPLRRLTRGSPWLAALVLLGAHLAVVLVIVLVWLVGLVPVLDDARWFPTALAGVTLVAGVVVTLGALGPWATQYEKEFSFLAALLLDRFHYLLLILTCMAGLLGAALIWADVRWHHVVATPEVRGLREEAVAMPIPPDWSLESAREKDDGFPAEVYEYEQVFDVPGSYRFPQLADWMASAGWEAVGGLQRVECDGQIERCTAEVAPAPGEDVVYLVEAWYHDSPVEGRPPSVRVSLQHRVSG